MAQPNIDDLLRSAMELPAEQRLALATELLESVEGPEDPEWAQAWAAELDRRLKELDAGTVKPVPWEQVKARLLEHLRAK